MPELIGIEANEAAIVNEVARIGSMSTIVARNDAEMGSAQETLKTWFVQHLRDAEQRLNEAEQLFETAERCGYDKSPYKRQIAKCRREVKVIEKGAITAASGYAMIPDIQADPFAVRVDRRRPIQTWASNRWGAGDVTTLSLPAGQGHYVDAGAYVTNRNFHDRFDENGKAVFKTQYAQSEYADVDFPSSMSHPDCMIAVHSAMELNVFDDIAISPSRAAKDDPIIVGRIKHYKSTWRPWNFLICWSLRPDQIF